jgi:hypothetical protein
MRVGGKSENKSACALAINEIGINILVLVLL